MAGVRGQRGRRKPTALKLAQGVPGGKHHLPQDEPQPSREDLSPPDHLSVAGRKVWATAVAQLNEVGVMTVMDRTALAHYCEQFVTWQTALANVRKKGLVLANKKTGILRQNPHLAIANQAHDRLLKMMQEFGMTPASRSGIKTRPGFRAAETKRPVNRFAVIQGGSSAK